MPRTSPYRIELSDAEREELETLARKYTAPYQEVVRAKIVSLANEGYSNTEIAQRLDVPRQIVSKWRRRYYEEHLDGLFDLERSGRSRHFPPQVIMLIKALACELTSQLDLPLSRLSNRENARAAVKQGIVAQISGTAVWRWLSADSICPWRHRCWIFPSDPHFAEKAGVVLDLYQRLWQGKRLNDDEYVLSTDEKTSIQARAPSSNDTACAQARTALRARVRTRRVVGVFGRLGWRTGKIDWAM